MATGYAPDPRMLVGGSSKGGYPQPDFQGLMTKLAYQLAGNPPPASEPMVHIPQAPLPYSPSTQSAGGGGIDVGSGLGALNNLNKGYNQLAGGVKPYSNPADFANIATTGAGALLGTGGLGFGAAPIAGDAALSGLGSIGTGAMFGTSGAGALGAAAPSAGLADLGTAGAGEMFGTSGGAAAGAADAGGLLAGSGISTALPLAAAGFAVTNYLNAGPLNDDKSKARNVSAYQQQMGGKPVTIPLGRTAWSGYALPDGRLIDSKTFNDLAGNWYGATYAPDGNQDQWAQKYQQTLSGLQDATLPKGYSWNATTGKVEKNF